MNQHIYRRESADQQYAAWCLECGYDGHHYRVFSYSPWHACGTGTPYTTEAEARAAIDDYIDRQVPLMRKEIGR
jgi:hypothetical protein